MRVQQHLELLEYLTRSNCISQRFIRALPSDALKAIWEIALNVKLGNVKLSQHEAELLARRKRSIGKLAVKSTKIEDKLRILTPSLLKALLRPAIRQLRDGNPHEVSA